MRKFHYIGDCVGKTIVKVSRYCDRVAIHFSDCTYTHFESEDDYDGAHRLANTEVGHGGIAKILLVESEAEYAAEETRRAVQRQHEQDSRDAETYRRLKEKFSKDGT